MSFVIIDSNNNVFLFIVLVGTIIIKCIYIYMSSNLNLSGSIHDIEYNINIYELLRIYYNIIIEY